VHKYGGKRRAAAGEREERAPLPPFMNGRVGRQWNSDARKQALDYACVSMLWRVFWFLISFLFFYQNIYVIK
jgi:hypothetical protein